MTPPGSPLVLEEERSSTRPPSRAARSRCPNPVRVWFPEFFQHITFGCDRWTCPHCGRWKSAVLARCLYLDAAVDPPTHVLTLTTRQPWDELDPAVYRRATFATFRRLRRHLGALDYLGFIEFTTGRGTRSGGHRRMHGHYPLKFRETRDLDVDQVLDLVIETWEVTTGAYVVEFAPLRVHQSVVHYLGLHHRKPQQAPPDAWRGMRLRPSRGYWHRPIADLRSEAADELLLESRAWRAGLTPLELLARERSAEAEVGGPGVAAR